MHNTMLFFTRKGRCYWLKCYEIPEGGKDSKGRAIQNLLNIDSDDSVNAFLRLRGLDDEQFLNSHYVVFATKNGIVKKTCLKAYSRPRTNGVNAINILEGDEVVDVRLTNGHNELVLANRNGRAVRFEESAVREMGRVATGVRGMKLDEGDDEVVGMIVVNHAEKETIMVVSENGYGKRSQVEDYRKTSRGVKGVKTLNITEKTGRLVSIKNVTDENDLMIINKSGITIRLAVAECRVMGRATQGVPNDVANQGKTSLPEQQKIAYEVAKKSVVLLKNDGGLLPIKKDVKKIAVIGHNAVAITANGGVGAGVKAPYEITPLMGIQNHANGIEVTFNEGYALPQAGGWGRPASSPSINTDLLIEAIKAAKEADLVIFVGGTSKSIETEGSDRSDIKLTLGQEELVAAISAVNPNIVSVIISGGPCDLQKLEKYSPAIVQGWWNGLEGGNALADVLFGKIAPSGKLPFTFPIKLEDSPAYAMGNFPQRASSDGDLFTNMYRQDLGGNGSSRRSNAVPDALYTEKLLVGYRWFDTKEKPVMYAFGHGLSYVDFGYSNIKTNKTKYGAKDVIKVTFNLKNEGGMEADEVAQLYVHYKDSKVERPYKELKAFKRVTLGAGETKTVTLEVPVSELRYWDESKTTDGWTLENGEIELMLGGASDDIRLKATVTI